MTIIIRNNREIKIIIEIKIKLVKIIIQIKSKLIFKNTVIANYVNPNLKRVLSKKVSIILKGNDIIKTMNHICKKLIKYKILSKLKRSIMNISQISKKLRNKIYCEQVQIKIEIKEISYENVGPGPKVIQKDNTMKKTDYLISFLTINHYEIQRDKKSIINMFNPTVYKDSVISQDKMKRNYKMKTIAEITENSSTNKNKNDHEQNYQKNPISPVHYTVIVRYKLIRYRFIFSQVQKRCSLKDLILNRVYKIDPSDAIALRYISYVFLTLGPQGTQARTCLLYTSPSPRDS